MTSRSNAGEIAESYVETYLRENCISYKRNMKIIKNKLCFLELDFVIPGAVIEVKNRYACHESDCEYIAKQLSRYNKYCTEMTIYLVMSGDLDMERFCKIINENEHMKNIKIITDYGYSSSFINFYYLMKFYNSSYI